MAIACLESLRSVDARELVLEPLDVIIEIIRRELNAPALELSAGSLSSLTPGWRSAAMLSIIFAVEAQFGFQMSSQEMESLQSVGDIVRVVGDRPAV